MSPEQLAKVKQQIAMAKAGLAASSLGASLGIHMGSETKAPKPTATGTSVTALTASVIDLRSVFISLLIPVTPREDTS